MGYLKEKTAKRVQKTTQSSNTLDLGSYHQKKPNGGMKEMISRKGTRLAGAMASILLMLLGIFAIPVNASAGPINLTDKLTTEEGTTTDLGGGDHLYRTFGTDAACGIVWRTEGKVHT